ncbi:MAG: hypothetical protein ACW98X_26045, partial [Promethearchaeota archaeon]
MREERFARDIESAAAKLEESPLEEGMRVVEESRGKLGDESLTGRGYELGIRARENPALAERIRQGQIEVKAKLAEMKKPEALSEESIQETYNIGMAQQYYNEAEQALKNVEQFRKGSKLPKEVKEAIEGPGSLVEQKFKAMEAKPKGKSLDEIGETIPTVYMPRIEAREGGHVKLPGVYLRFGEPTGKASEIFYLGKKVGDEKGVSTYKAWYDPKTDKYVLESGGEDIITGQAELSIGRRKVYQVSGRDIGIGSDEETLLDVASTKIIKEIPRSKIVTTSDPHITFSDELLEGKNIPDWESAAKEAKAKPLDELTQPVGKEKKLSELPEYAQQAILEEGRVRRVNIGGSIDAPDPFAGFVWSKQTIPIKNISGNITEKFVYRGARTKGPIVIDDRGQVIDGYNRLYEAIKRGDKTIDAYIAKKTKPLDFEKEFIKEQAVKGKKATTPTVAARQAAKEKLAQDVKAGKEDLFTVAEKKKQKDIFEGVKESDLTLGQISKMDDIVKRAKATESGMIGVRLPKNITRAEKKYLVDKGININQSRGHLAGTYSQAKRAEDLREKVTKKVSLSGKDFSKGIRTAIAEDIKGTKAGIVADPYRNLRGFLKENKLKLSPEEMARITNFAKALAKEGIGEGARVKRFEEYLTKNFKDFKFEKARIQQTAPPDAIATPPPTNLPGDAERFRAAFNQSKAEFEAVNKTTAKGIYEATKRNLVDVSGNLKKKLLKSDQGKQSVIKHDLIAGAGPRSTLLFNEKRALIYDKLSLDELNTLDA